MGDPVDPSIGLPAAAPKALKAFLDCSGAAVLFANGSIPWLSVSALVPDSLKDIVPDVAPSVTIESTSATTATISISIGGIPITSIPASISNGTLNLDTSGLPGAVAGPLNDQMTNLNAWFKAHGKQLGPPTFARTSVTLTKVPLAPQAQAAQVPAGQGAGGKPGGAPQGAGGKPGQK